MAKRVLWCLLALFVGFYTFHGEYFWSKWAVLLFILAFAIGIRIKNSFTLSAGIAWAYVVFSGLCLFAWRENYISNFQNPLMETRFDSNAAQATAFFLIVTFFAVSSTQREHQILRRVFSSLCLVNSIFVLFQIGLSRATAFKQGGFLEQGSMNGSLIAVTYPFLLEGTVLKNKSIRFWLRLAPIVAIAMVSVIDSASNPFGVAVIVVSTIILYPIGYKFSRKRVFYTLSGIAVSTIIFLKLNPSLFNSSGRFQMYSYAVKSFIGKGWFHELFGTGNGSFVEFGPMIQKENGYSRGVGSWFWLHSDWLQSVFEFGIVGILIFIWLAIDCVRGARRDPYLLASLMGFMAAAIFQYPVHVSLFAFLGASLAAMSLLKVSQIPLRPRKSLGA